MNSDVVLLTQRLRLREYRARAEAVQAWAVLAADPATDHEESRNVAPTKGGAFSARVTTARSALPRTRFELAVTLRDGGELIGGVRIEIIDAARSQGDIGYALHPDFWSRGYGTEAATAIVRFGFEDLGLSRIWATCDPANAASIRVLEKTGMRHEGVLPRGGPFPGNPRTSRLYGITVDAFRRLALTHPCGAAASP